MKKLITFAFLLIIGGLIAFVAIQYTHRPSSSPKITLSPTVSSTPSQKPIHAPVNIFEGERHEDGHPPLATQIVNESLNTVFSFTMHPELSNGGVNDAWTLAEHINGPPWTTLKDFKDPFGAVAIARISFSPDNRYLAFRTRTVLGFGVYAFTLIVFDLQSGKTIHVNAPLELSSYKGATVPYIESYEWNGTKLNMVIYTVEMVYIQKPETLEYYRIDPKQLWQYDLVSKQYTFLKNLDE